VLSYSLAINIISGCWIVFLFVWVSTAPSAKPSIYRESGVHRVRYWVLLIIAYFLLFKGRQFPDPLKILVIPNTELSAWIGAVLCVIGFLFSVWARITLGRNWSGAITLKENHELIVRGPYRFVRHPIYTGLLAMILGTAIARGHLGGLIAIVFAFASFWIKLSAEEDLMLEHFPEQYGAYRQRAKRIIPFVL